MIKGQLMHSFQKPKTNETASDNPRPVGMYEEVEHNPGVVFNLFTKLWH